MIDREIIEEALEIAEENDYFGRLNSEYEKIENGKCSGCTNCCSESVHTYFTEFLNIINYLDKDKEKYDRLIPKIEKYYFEELYKNNKCPMLASDGRCEIYPVRPLVCRLFGHYTKKEHEGNYGKVHEGNKGVKKYIKEEYDIDVPVEVVDKKIEHCENFVIDKKMDKETRLEISDGILGLDSKYFIYELIDEDALNLGLVDWFMYLNHGDDIFEEKIKRTKEILK